MSQPSNSSELYSRSDIRSDSDSKMTGSEWVMCYLGLGSNLVNELGSPVEHLQQAIEGLREHEGIKTFVFPHFMLLRQWDHKISQTLSMLWLVLKLS